jgi:hypothetical protein
VWEATVAGDAVYLVAGEAGGWRGSGGGTLYRQSPDGGAPEKLLGPLPNLRSPSATPDGQQMAAVVGLAPKARVIRIDAQARTVAEVLDAPGDVETVGLSPDGAALALGLRTQRCAILRDGSLTPVRRYWDRLPRPVWLPDGRGFVPYAGSDLYLKLDGSLGALADVPAVWLPDPDAPSDPPPSWLSAPGTLSPDGKRVAAVDHGVVWLAEAQAPERPRQLVGLGAERVGLPLFLARPAEGGQ